MKKGIKSKNEIIEASLEVFNNLGNNITMNQLAQEIGASRGRINHFFPTRDSLFLALAEIYEKKFYEIQLNYDSNLEKYKNQISALVEFLSSVMDLQYQYRCAIVYIISQLNNKEINKHTQKTYALAKEKSFKRFEAMVENGFLKPEILISENFEPFFFQISNLLTNWLVHFFLYEHNKTLSQVKREFIAGIMKLYKFYFTQDGLESYHLATGELNTFEE